MYEWGVGFSVVLNHITLPLKGVHHKMRTTTKDQTPRHASVGVLGALLYEIVLPCYCRLYVLGISARDVGCSVVLNNITLLLQITHFEMRATKTERSFSGCVQPLQIVCLGMCVTTLKCKPRDACDGHWVHCCIKQCYLAVVNYASRCVQLLQVECLVMHTTNVEWMPRDACDGHWMHYFIKLYYLATVHHTNRDVCKYHRKYASACEGRGCWVHHCI